MDELDRLNEWAAHREQELAREAVVQARRDEMYRPPKLLCPKCGHAEHALLDRPRCELCFCELLVGS